MQPLTSRTLFASAALLLASSAPAIELRVSTAFEGGMNPPAHRGLSL